MGMRRWREKSCIAWCRKELEEVRTGEKLDSSGKTSNNISPEHGHNLEQRGVFNTLHWDEPCLKIYTEVSVQDSIPTLSQTYR